MSRALRQEDLENISKGYGAALTLVQQSLAELKEKVSVLEKQIPVGTPDAPKSNQSNH